MEIPVTDSASAPPLVEMAAPVVVDSVAPVVVDAPAPVVVDAPAPVEPVALDGGAKPKSKRSRSRKSRSRKATSRGKGRMSRGKGKGKGRMLKGGEFGYDAFGDLDLGRFPAQTNLPYSGLSRNEDYDAINKNLKNPLYKSAEDSYMQLHKLYMQMSKTRMSEANKIKLLNEVRSNNEDMHFKEGEEPEWFQDYVGAIDEKILEAEKAIQDKNKKHAASLEYQAAIEEKKLAYMIMEYLSGVAVGSGEGARAWRSDRTRTGEPGSLERKYKRNVDSSKVENAAAAAAEKTQRNVRDAVARIRGAAPQAAAAAAAAAAAPAAPAAAAPAASEGPVAAVLNAIGSVFNLGSNSASPAAPASVIDVRSVSGSPQAVQNEQDLLEDRRVEQAARIAASGSPGATQDQIQLAGVRAVRANQEERERRRSRRLQGLSPGGFIGGAKKKRSPSRSKKAKSRSHRKAIKHNK